MTQPENTELPERFEDKAMRLVHKYCQESLSGAFVEPDNIRLVWFCKTLQNWKALIVIALPGGLFFEVTYNGVKQEAYVDVYEKRENVVVPD
jgi:hypothetical protein